MNDLGHSPDLFVRLGILDPAGLQRCLETQREFRTQGVELDLPDVILNLGLATPEQLARVKEASPLPSAPPTPPPAFPPTPPPAKPGAATSLPAQMGVYRILRPIARGGMGVVYLAEHVQLGQKVAIKVLAEQFSKRPAIQARFRREGTASARLDHPNIAATLEMGQEGDKGYIVTEYLEGGSLETLLQQERKLPHERAVAILCDILAGLEHAHARGVIHRDIKPGNILLTRGGRAKLIDFGLAKDAESAVVLTLSGMVMGTPAYMSPEQASGDRGGPASDLYACAILAFFMLTGRKPFEGRTAVETMMKQVNEPLPSIRAANPAVPEALERVIRKMAEKDPARRHATAAEALADVRRAMGEEISDTKVRKVKSWVPWVWVGVSAALTAAAAAHFFLNRL